MIYDSISINFETTGKDEDDVEFMIANDEFDIHHSSGLIISLSMADTLKLRDFLNFAIPG